LAPPARRGPTRKPQTNESDARRPGNWGPFFQLVADPEAAPRVKNAAGRAFSLDRFRPREMEVAGLVRRSLRRNKPTLIRRVTFDLTGLPTDGRKRSNAFSPCG